MLLMLTICPGHTLTIIIILVTPAWSTSINVIMCMVILLPPLGGWEMVMITVGLIFTVTVDGGWWISFP